MCTVRLRVMHGSHFVSLIIHRRGKDQFNLGEKVRDFFYPPLCGDNTNNILLFVFSTMGSLMTSETDRILGFM